MRLSIGGLQGFSFCADISVRLFTVCFCCLLFLYFSKMLWRKRPRLSGWNTLNNPAHFAFFSWEEEKNWIYPGTSSGHSGYTSTTTTVWLIHSRRRRSVGCIFIRFCIASFVRSFVWLFVCSVSFLSVCAKAQTQTRVLVPLKSCDW